MTEEAAAVQVSSFLIAHVRSHARGQGNFLNAWTRLSEATTHGVTGKLR